jgi:hypothetical protein
MNFNLSILFALVQCCILTSASFCQSNSVVAGHSHDDVAARILELGLKDGEAYDMLAELTSQAGHRLSGSPGAAAAVELTLQMMLSKGFDNVHLEPIMVPHWVRGPVEEAAVLNSRTMGTVPLNICALGRSIATLPDGIVAEIVEIKSFAELRALGDQAEGKIVFFNRAFDPTELNTFAAYGGAVDQRSRGAIEAAKVGGVAALVRSMTLTVDDVPHTGAMNYEEGVKKIPAAAVSTVGANLLSDLLKQEQNVTVRMKLTCQTLPDVPSANVVGEITGSERPHEIIVVGGHLDSWDKGTGAHDDGSGCVQAIEVLNLIKKSGLKPKRTIRAVMFMNEENGLGGAKAYPVAPQREGETHVAAVESDRGGFAPLGFTVQADSLVLEKVLHWKNIFENIEAGRIIKGHGGADISQLVEKGVPGFGLLPENHRYFDYHHSDHDTIDKVHQRELEMGAIVEAVLCYLISEDGL